MASTLGIIIFYRFLILVSILEPIVAVPLFTRRGTTWDDSPGQAIIDGGAAGFGVLNDIWNDLIEPSTEKENLPNQIQSQPETSNTPELSSPPIFGPNMMGQCSASTQSLGSADDQLPGNGDILTPDGSIPGLNEEYEGYIQQSTKTGRPLMNMCDAPDGKPEDAYLVHEIGYVEEGLEWRQWPAAILVSDPVKQFDIRYDLQRKGGQLVFRKVPNYKFLRKNTVVKLGYLQRRGWLVGAGEPKEAALIWFETFIKSVKHRPYIPNPLKKVFPPHYTKLWVKRVFNKLLTEVSPHWVPIINSGQNELD